MNPTQLINQYFDAFNKGDVNALLATLSENVAHDINEGPTEVGKEAFKRFKAHMDDCYKETIVDLVVMENGNVGAAAFTVQGEYLKTDGDLPAATGQKYSIPAAAFFTVEDSKISRITSYYNLKGWIAAIGG